jgi:putative ABC transport system permease protein
MNDLLQDLRLAWRSCLAPGHRIVTLVAMIALALGIGANTAVYSVLDGLLLRPLAFPHADRLVSLKYVAENDLAVNSAPGLGDAMSFPNYQDIARLSPEFDAVASYQWDLLNLAGPDGAEALVSVRVEPGMWRVLGVGQGPDGLRMRLGQVFDSTNGTIDAPVVVMTERLWKRSFGARPDVVGSTVRIDGRPVTVLGVLPATFEFPGVIPGAVNLSTRTPDLFTPLDRRGDLTQRSDQNYMVIGRLRAGVDLGAARADLAVVSGQLAAAYPAENQGRWIAATGLKERLSGYLRPLLYTLMGAMAVVLLIACLNVANLLLARGSARTRELSIRTALGASRQRLARQLLVESGLLAVAGLGLGVWVARVGLAALLALAPENIDRLDAVTIDLRVLAFAALITGVSAIGFGLLPAVQLSRTSPGAVLGETARGGVGAGRVRSRRALVVVEVALSLVLVAAAGLLIRSYANVRSVDAGFEADHAFSFILMLSGQGYQADSGRSAFIRRAVTELDRIPGVIGAAAVSVPPLAGLGSSGTVSVDGAEFVPPNQRPSAAFRQVSPTYFDLMGIRHVAGRQFTVADDATRPDVAILSANLAAKLFGAVAPLGRRVTVWGRSREIVGVVGDIREYGFDAPAPFAVYVPTDQEPFFAGGFVLRTTADPSTLAEPVRHAIATVDPSLAMISARSLEATVAASLAQRRFSMTLLATFAGIALLLAAIGLYGVLAYLVSQRRREIGVRLALGASASRVLRRVLVDGLRLAGAGVVVGIAGAIGVAFLIRGLLFDVKPLDPVVLLTGPVVLGVVTVLATVIPARRAARVDPVEVLRAE